MDSQRKQYHSIPLRTHQARAGQTRTTTGPYAIPERQTRVAQPQTQAPKSQSLVSHAAMPVLPDEDMVFSPAPSHTSTLRYTDEYGRDVIRQGDKRLIVKHAQAPKRRIHWLFPAGLGMIATLALWIGGQWAVTSVQAHNLDNTYGNPRYWQTDQVLGIDGDSAAHKSHLIFQNLNGEVVFIVIPAGNLTKSVVYPVARLYGDDAASWPVTAKFEDVNNDGKMDIVIEVDNQQIVYLGTGTGFKPQAQ
jgi:hypothetical protein